jgi:hypothetical protein
MSHAAPVDEIPAVLSADVEHFITHHPGAWADLLRRVAFEYDLAGTIDPLEQERLADTFAESLSPLQVDQFDTLEAAEIEDVMRQRQAAFELGRLYERAKGGA